MNRLMQRSKRASLNQLVGKQLHRVRHRKTEHLCGLQIDHKLKSGRLQDWKVRRFGTLEYSGRVVARQLIRICDARAIADQTPGNNKFAKVVDRGKPMFCREGNDLRAARVEICAGTD